MVLLTDQQRAAGPYDSEGMRTFQENHLPHQNALRASGWTFEQHRIVSSACVPSRASLFTGVPAATHNVFNTDGFAKQDDDAGLQWLDPQQHTTLGHRAQDLGVKTAYLGKWHLSPTPLPGVSTAFTPPPTDHRAWQDLTNAYRSANVLAPFGFDDWVGPEPHGHHLHNSARMRDARYVQQAQDWLHRHAKDGPFLLVISLVDPHDIVFWPQWSAFRRRWLTHGIQPPIGPCASEFDSHDRHPSALQAYAKTYFNAYGPASIIRPLYTRQREAYRQFYCGLLKRSDEHIGTILQTLHDAGLEDTTSVVFSSDHGELLGAHGGLHQKWYNAFEETVRVPLVIRPARALGSGTKQITHLTDHLDIVPTTLGLLAPDAPLRQEIHPSASGRDLLKPLSARATHFESRDHILEGEHPFGAMGRVYPILGRIWPMRYPTFTSTNTAVQAHIERDGQRLWKCIRYFNPSSPSDSANNEWMVFDLSQDPSEQTNLVEHPEHAEDIARLKTELLGWGRSTP